MSFSSILAEIAEDTDRDSLAMLAGKYPSIRTYADVGSKFVELTPRLRTFGGERADEYVNDPSLTLDYAEHWAKWRKANWDEDFKGTRAERMKQEKLEQAEAKILELEARSNTDMTPEEIRALAKEVAAETLKTGGVLTEAQLETKMGEFAARQRGEFNANLLQFEDVFDQLGPLVVEHKAEFGESLSARKVFDKMREKGFSGTASDAYKQVYGDKINAKSAEARTAELKAEREAGALEERKRLAAENSGRAMPVGASEGRKMGPVQRKVMERAKSEDTGNYKLGSGAISAKASQEYREKQFAGAN